MPPRIATTSSIHGTEPDAPSVPPIFGWRLSSSESGDSDSDTSSTGDLYHPARGLPLTHPSHIPVPACVPRLDLAPVFAQMESDIAKEVPPPPRPKVRTDHAKDEADALSAILARNRAEKREKMSTTTPPLATRGDTRHSRRFLRERMRDESPRNPKGPSVSSKFPKPSMSPTSTTTSTTTRPVRPAPPSPTRLATADPSGPNSRDHTPVRGMLLPATTMTSPSASPSTSIPISTAKATTSTGKKKSTSRTASHTKDRSTAWTDDTRKPIDLDTSFGFPVRAPDSPDSPSVPLGARWPADVNRSSSPSPAPPLPAATLVCISNAQATPVPRRSSPGVAKGTESPTPNWSAAERGGLVAVAARVRPLIDEERARGSTEQVVVSTSRSPPTSTPASSPSPVHLGGLVMTGSGPDGSFAYENVFGPAVSQQQLYDQAVAPAVRQCVEGLTCTLLAYGPTGSGKTYTMGTGEDHARMLRPALARAQHAEDGHDESLGLALPPGSGVLPRAVTDLFAGLQARVRAEPGLTFDARCRFVEMYQEEIRDLLAPAGSGNGIPWGARARGPSGGGLPLQDYGDGSVAVVGCSEVMVYRAADALRAFAAGARNRTTGSTAINDVSSRSHAVFSVLIDLEEGEDSVRGRGRLRTTFALHVVDLAGSERNKVAQASGERFKEAVSINQGLLALGNVISALADMAAGGKPRHVPYRDSKLTRMLRDSLGGNSNTVMIACVSCASAAVAETEATLRYAKRASTVRNRVSRVTSWSAEAPETLAELRTLQQVLEQADAGSLGSTVPDLQRFGNDVLWTMLQRLRAAARRQRERAREGDSQNAHITETYQQEQQHVAELTRDRGAPSMGTSPVRPAVVALKHRRREQEELRRSTGSPLGSRPGTGHQPPLLSSVDDASVMELAARLEAGIRAGTVSAAARASLLEVVSGQRSSSSTADAVSVTDGYDNIAATSRVPVAVQIPTLTRSEKKKADREAKKLAKKKRVKQNATTLTTTTTASSTTLSDLDRLTKALQNVSAFDAKIDALEAGDDFEGMELAMRAIERDLRALDVHNARHPQDRDDEMDELVLRRLKEANGSPSTTIKSSNTTPKTDKKRATPKSNKGKKSSSDASESPGPVTPAPATSPTPSHRTPPPTPVAGSEKVRSSSRSSANVFTPSSPLDPRHTLAIKHVRVGGRMALEERFLSTELKLADLDHALDRRQSRARSPAPSVFSSPSEMNEVSPYPDRTQSRRSEVTSPAPTVTSPSVVRRLVSEENNGETHDGRVVTTTTPSSSPATAPTSSSRRSAANQQKWERRNASPPSRSPVVRPAAVSPPPTAASDHSLARGETSKSPSTPGYAARMAAIRGTSQSTSRRSGALNPHPGMTAEPTTTTNLKTRGASGSHTSSSGRTSRSSLASRPTTSRASPSYPTPTRSPTRRDSLSPTRRKSLSVSPEPPNSPPPTRFPGTAASSLSPTAPPQKQQLGISTTPTGSPIIPTKPPLGLRSRSSTKGPNLQFGTPSASPSPSHSHQGSPDLPFTTSSVSPPSTRGRARTDSRGRAWASPSVVTSHQIDLVDLSDEENGPTTWMAPVSPLAGGGGGLWRDGLQSSSSAAVDVTLVTDVSLANMGAENDKADVQVGTE